MTRIGVLPALVTLGNGYCGLLSIYKTADGDFYTASWLIMLAMGFDALDGKIARIAGVTSKFGGYLDSLSDALSFGVAPAFLVKEVMREDYPGKLLVLLTAIFALGALLRLARYNVEHSMGEGLDKDEGEVASFDGIPTPGAAGIIAALVLLAEDPSALTSYTVVLMTLPFLCVILGCLMVSRVRYIHFGHRFLKGRREFSYLFKVVVLGILVTKFPHETLAIAFVAYGIAGPFVGRRVRHDEPLPKPEITERP
ncbi:MAG: CDP-diacylglycerol--serine O-phosphatidyltransferase [Planctomycetota bacterium]|jgi:CDP-diacylglycerol--serine O-phosphatidyltransferase|nr:CDP-diacylglycerol--serine O-phosphatidyltransferase [Planctomycetota bacterium]